MLVGPVFTREAVTAPRRARLYFWRSAYVAAFFALMCTAWMVLTGTQLVRNAGDLARFGSFLFQLLAPLQLAVVVFFSALATASAVAQEKDRRTLVLLLMTRLSNSELVLGKLLASMLNVLVLLAAALPLFLMIVLFGGVSFAQIVRTFLVTLITALVAGSLGSTIALWREKTFQTLALTALVLVFWLAAWEIVAATGTEVLGVPAATWADSFSPMRAILEATRPYHQPVAALGPLGSTVNVYLLAAAVAAVLLNGLAIFRVRVWNPSREAWQREPDETRASIFSEELQPLVEDAAPRDGGSTAWSMERAAKAAANEAQRQVRTRHAWDNPIIWREICTWAYGRKVILIRAAYVLLAAVAAAVLYYLDTTPDGITWAGATWTMIPLGLLSLAMVNALAVTSVTNERDGRALDLLLVTDITPKEFIFGKLGGIFYNTKEMVLAPMLLCVYLWYLRAIDGESLRYLLGGMVVLNVFVAMLGIHVGMIYSNSRTAISVSLGTVFFLFLGVAVCMRIMVAFGGSFHVQLAPFGIIMGGGGVGLYFALGFRNPSPAITLAALVCPFATFYAITSFWLQQTLGVFLVVVLTYGFTTAAMLIPALYEFDVATGRTTGDEE